MECFVGASFINKIVFFTVLFVFMLFMSNGFAVTDENILLYVDKNGEVEDPLTITEWEAVNFPLWMDDKACRYWIKLPLKTDDEGKWLSLGWPNIWQWQMITKCSALIEYPDGEIEKFIWPHGYKPYRLIFPMKREIFSVAAPESLVLRLDCLPYSIFVPDITFLSTETLWQEQLKYSALFYLYCGMILVLVIVAAILSFVVSDRIFFFYVIMLLSGTISIYAQVPVFDFEHLSVSVAGWSAIFHIAIAGYYIGSLLFAGNFLDPEKKQKHLHRYLYGVVLVCFLYIAFYGLMGKTLQENLLYVMDICALSPIIVAVWLWRKGNRVALYYLIINIIYLPIYVYFIVVTKATIHPFIPIYVLLILGSLTEAMGYSVAVAYRLYITLKHKQSIEEQNRILKREQMESALLARDAELRMLRFQMNPHFLFNALNSLIAEIGESPKNAVKMAQKLSEYLRYTLTARENIRIEDELEAVQRYLELESFRYEDKLVVRIDAEENCMDIRIPMFTLQPLVENALKYGMQTSPMPLTVDIQIKKEYGYVRISVSNTGRWVDTQTASTGIGLKNIRERLARSYNDAGSVYWEQKSERVEVSLLIPNHR